MCCRLAQVLEADVSTCQQVCIEDVKCTAFVVRAASRSRQCTTHCLAQICCCSFSALFRMACFEGHWRTELSAYHGFMLSRYIRVVLSGIWSQLLFSRPDPQGPGQEHGQMRWMHPVKSPEHPRYLVNTHFWGKSCCVNATTRMQPLPSIETGSTAST
eukprot:2864359-Pleurochrysis_carterae.AAC.1